MINSIQLKNFRSWKDVLIEFCSGVNVITGENDSGKTNILRGINWDVNNRPTGDDIFPLYWEGNPEVALNIEDKTVTRYRSKTENLYKLTGHKDSFKSFGQGVPEAIRQHLNFSPVNIAFQLEGPFLLGRSPADVARYYNDAVNLEIIDQAISNIAKTLRDEKSELAKLKSDQEKHIEKLKDFEWLEEAEPKLIALEKLQAARLRKEKEFSDLHTLTESLILFEKEMRETEKITIHEQALLSLINLQGKIELRQTDYDLLSDYLEILKQLEALDKQLQTVIGFEKNTDTLLELASAIELKKRDIAELKFYADQINQYNKVEEEIQGKISHEQVIIQLLKLDRQIEIKIGEYNELQGLIEKWHDLGKDLSLITGELQKLENEFKQLVPDVCPILDVQCDRLKERKGK